jgi:vanillate O-demethylase ferredoxin subunit
MNTLTVKVIKKTVEAEDIVSFAFASADGAPLPSFSAGSHIDVHLASGLVRQYSLCNDPHESQHYQIAVLKDPQSRGGSVAVHATIQEGDMVTISDPRNHFALEPADHYLLFAGGIGVTPILCMAERLSRIDAGFDLHYSARSKERTAFYDRIAGSAFADRAQFHFDSGDGGAGKLDLPAVLAAAAPGAHLYVCGPAGYIEFIIGSARAAGWDETRIHVEYFGAAPQDTAGDVAFDVKIASTGKVYRIAADKPVTTALLEYGIDIMVSCEQGVCGTCITRVLDGQPDHRDMYLTDEEKAANDQFTPCCSRSRSNCLVLDL